MPDAPHGALHIDDALFAPATEEEKRGLRTVHEPVTYWQDVRRKFRSNKAAFASLIFILLAILLAFIGPFFSPFSYDQQVRGSEYIPPFANALHPLGTDNLGRDELVRLMYGTRISLLIGILASLMVVAIGVLYGSVAAYFGGLTDGILMRIVDIIYSVPPLLVVILLSVVINAPLRALFNAHRVPAFLNAAGPGILSLFITFALLYWADMARMVRGRILSIRESEFVIAAKALGIRPRRIIRRHLIPNSTGVIIVTATLNVPSAIFAEAFLSYLGLGVSAPMCSLGSLAGDALNGLYTYPVYLILPSVLISLIILAFNMVGDGLRDALDPRFAGKRKISRA